MSASQRTSNFVLIAAGVGLWYVGAKVFADYHDALAVGHHDSFQHKHATAIGSVLSITGLGLAVYGTYGVNKNWGKLFGGVLGGLVAFNAYKHKHGEPLISLSPLKFPGTLHA
jgi:predicted cobalt transporter CbtA